jgi:hypothetical protein
MYNWRIHTKKHKKMKKLVDEGINEIISLQELDRKLDEILGICPERKRKLK